MGLNRTRAGTYQHIESCLNVCVNGIVKKLSTHSCEHIHSNIVKCVDMRLLCYTIANFEEILDQEQH